MPIFLTLGPITFANEEIPEVIPFGGAQSIKVFEYVGGQRAVQSMGRQDHDYSWEGWFRGSTAQFRARFLDGLRISGQQQTLTYSQFNYLVVIKDLKCDFKRFYEIPYQITVTVIQDLNNPFTVLLPVTYNETVFDLMDEAADLAEDIATPSVSSAIALLAYTINQVGNIDNASSASLQTITVPLQEAQQSVTDAINQVTSGLF